MEFSLKDDELGDPFLAEEAVLALDLATPNKIRRMREITRDVSSIVADDLSGKGLELVDMKLEFGEDQGELLVIDEISGDTMRVHDPAKDEILDQIALAEKLNVI